MLSRCLSSFLLRLLALVARWLNKPLHHYISFKRDRPFLTLGLTGKSKTRPIGWVVVSFYWLCVHSIGEERTIFFVQDLPSTLSTFDCCKVDG